MSLILNPYRHGVAGPFDPTSYGSPVVGLWAADPAWTPPSDGGAIEVADVPVNFGSDGGANWSTAGVARPVYRAADADINGNPGIEWTTGQGIFFIDDSAMAAVSQPVSMVWAGYAGATVVHLLDSRNLSSRLLLSHDASDELRLFAGSANVVVTSASAFPRSAPYVIVAVFDRTAGIIRVNSTEYGGAITDPGANGLDGVTLMADNNDTLSTSAGILSFASVYSGDITGEAWFSGFESAAMSYIGA